MSTVFQREEHDVEMDSNDACRVPERETLGRDEKLQVYVVTEEKEHEVAIKKMRNMYVTIQKRNPVRKEKK